MWKNGKTCWWLYEKSLCLALWKIYFFLIPVNISLPFRWTLSIRWKCFSELRSLGEGWKVKQPVDSTAHFPIEPYPNKIAQCLRYHSISNFSSNIRKRRKKSIFFPFTGLTKGEHLIASCHPDDKLSLEAFKKLGGNSITQNEDVVEKSDILFLSVKPNAATTVLNEVKHLTGGKLLVSIAMGITTNNIEQVSDNSI